MYYFITVRIRNVEQNIFTLILFFKYNYHLTMFICVVIKEKLPFLWQHSDISALRFSELFTRILSYKNLFPTQFPRNSKKIIFQMRYHNTAHQFAFVSEFNHAIKS